jgi:hypothetical protein
MRHIFATWISNQHARLVFLLAMNQSRGFVFEYGELPSRVKAIIQRAMCRLCADSGRSRDHY